MASLHEAVNANNVELVRSLLEAGTDPNDNESLYHSTEHRDHACLKLLLKHGARIEGTNALKHMLDYEDLEGAEILLQAGAKPELHWAIFRRRSAPIIGRMLHYGAAPNERSHEGRSPYAHAVVGLLWDIAGVLMDRGADTTLTLFETGLGGGPMPPFDGNLLDPKQLAAQASMHYTDNVRRMLDAGYPVDAQGWELGATAMHWACWKGFPDLAELLLARGASLTIEDTQFKATAEGWLDHGIENCHEPDGDYEAVRRMIKSSRQPHDQA